MFRPPSLRRILVALFWLCVMLALFGACLLAQRAMGLKYE